MLVRYQLIQRRGTAGTAQVIAISLAEICLRIFWSQQIRCRSTFELQDCLEMCLATQKAPDWGRITHDSTYSYTYRTEGQVICHSLPVRWGWEVYAPTPKFGSLVHLLRFSSWQRYDICFSFCKAPAFVTCGLWWPILKLAKYASTRHVYWCWNP
jgi:hypothetical protein